MADSNEIPRFRFSDKRVDDSWKEEIRKERQAAPAPAPAAPPATVRSEHAEEDAPAAAPESAAPPEAAPAPAAKKLPERTGTPQEQLQSKIFLSFLARMAQQALMQLGQMANPYTGQAELDLEGAKHTIELLTVLQLRTKGNLTKEEEEALKQMVHELKISFVEINAEMQRQMAAQMAQAMQQPGGGAPGTMRPGPGGSIPGLGRR